MNEAVAFRELPELSGSGGKKSALSFGSGLKEDRPPLAISSRSGQFEIDHEKKTPLRSCASSENSFTEVSAGSDTKVAVSV
jgi:hypothetical protein